VTITQSKNQVTSTFTLLFCSEAVLLFFAYTL
jgi:hypothetical protein